MKQFLEKGLFGTMRFIALPKILLFIGFSADSQAAVEIRKEEKSGVTAQFITCRHPSDLTQGFDPAYIQLDHGHGVSRLAIGEIKKMHVTVDGVAAIWFDESPAQGERTATRLVVPATVLPPATVEAMLTTPRPLPPDLPFLPGFRLAHEAFRMPFPDQFHRLDSRLPRFDAAIKVLAKESASDAIAVFGLQEQEDAFRQGRVFLNKHLVVIQTDTRPELAEVPKGGFPELRKRLVRFPRNFYYTLKHPRERLSDLAQFSQPRSFDEDATSYLVSALRRPEDNETQPGLQFAHSACFMQMKSRILIIHAFTEYKSREDLDWVEKSCVLFRDELRRVNNISPQTGE